MALSTVVAIAALEVAFRAAGYLPLYDVYSKPEVFWTKDPLLGWSLEPGSKGWYVGPRPFPISFRARVRINSLGLRGPEVAPVADGGRRVLFLGDSQTAGFEVAEDRTFAALTGKRLNRLLPFEVQAVNAGIRGYGTDQALLLYRRKLHKLRPDLVVYNPTSNDPEDNTTLHRPRRPFGKAAFALKSDGSTSLVGHPIPDYPACSSYRLDSAYRPARVDKLPARALCAVETRLSDRSALFSFATTRLRQNPGLVDKVRRAGGEQPKTTPKRSGPPIAPAPATPPGAPAPATSSPAGAELSFEHRLTSVLVQKIARLAKDDGARFVLLADDGDLANLDVAAFQRDAIEIVRPNEVLGADQRPFRIPNDGHLNETGHRRVAELLAPRVAAMLRP